LTGVFRVWGSGEKPGGLPVNLSKTCGGFNYWITGFPSEWAPDTAIIIGGNGASENLANIKRLEIFSIIYQCLGNIC